MHFFYIVVLFSLAECLQMTIKGNELTFVVLYIGRFADDFCEITKQASLEKRVIESRLSCFAWLL